MIRVNRLNESQLKESLMREIEELNELQKQLQHQLADSPNGTLHIQKNGKGKYTQFFICDENRKRKYLPSAKYDTARLLAQKDYNQKILTMVQARIRGVKQLLRKYEQMLEEVYGRLPDARKKLVIPVVSSEEEFVKEWYGKYPGSANLYPNHFAIPSERGEMVRSKSEKILADLFNSRGIPYIYEPGIELKKGRIIYPDFLLLNVRQRKTYVYEHFGMIDNPEYAGNMIEKINLYQECGYGDKLLFSMETSTKPLNTKSVGKMLCHFV